jgi:DinB superfamily
MKGMSEPGRGRDPEPLLSGLIVTSSERHDDMANLVRGLPAGALTWSPGGDAPALAGLALHVLDVERYLVAIASGEQIEWSGQDGSRIHDEASEHELVAAIAEMGRLLGQALERAADARLSELQPGGTGTVGAALVEDLDHVAVHVGQMQLTRNLYEVAHPEAPRTYDHWGVGDI